MTDMQTGDTFTIGDVVFTATDTDTAKAVSAADTANEHTATCKVAADAGLIDITYPSQKLPSATARSWQQLELRHLKFYVS